MSGFSKKKTIVVISLIIIFALQYLYIDYYNSTHNANYAKLLKSPVDDYIPFVPKWIWSYFLYYLWVLLPLYFIKNERQLYIAAATFFITQTLASITFVLFPVYIPQQNIANIPYPEKYLFKILYSVDKSYNLFPSLHTAFSVLIAYFAFQFSKNKVFNFIVLTGTILIIASTVLIKQHYFLDILGGLLYAFTGIYIVKLSAAFVEKFYMKQV